MMLSAAVVGALALVATPFVVAAADGITQTFDYSGTDQQFTVPSGITKLTVSLLGGEGGLGGWDNTGPLQGGYRGAVTGTLAVTPGEVLTIGVGHGGYEGASRLGSAPGGLPGTNPIPGYNGGTGGIAGNEGSSGAGGGGGAATVILAGTETIIAGGGGGGGGSGQYAPTAGQPGASSFTARTDDPTTGTGEDGINTNSVCVEGIRCDGGASGAGGGGAIGGGPGAVAYGAGSSTEYFGYGGSPGANDSSGLTDGNAVYQYYATDDANGSVSITYDVSAPDAPTGVSGTAADGAVNLAWLAPLSAGGSDITDYELQYAIVSADPDWQDFADGVSPDTSATITGLTDGTAYEFRVAATNTFGTSDYSDPSAGVTPSSVPGAPTISSVTPSDGTLTVGFTTVTPVSPVTEYDYQLDSGSWINAGASPVVIGGLTNGTSYSVRVRAVNAIGAGAASDPGSGTPVATPSAPTITSISTGIGTASVSFTEGNAGGSPVTGYDYRLDDGDWTPTGTTLSPFSLTGLDAGTSYSIQLRAESDAGDGADSATSTFTTPTTPGAPTISSISTGDGSLSVNFSSGSTGGLAISGYEYQLATDGPWVAAPSSASPLVLSGLTNGTTYHVSLRAHNAIGDGTASDAVSATPVTTPGPPVLLAGSVAGSDQQLDATFTAPTSDGGSAITGYEYSTDGGATWRARATGTTDSPLTITTLSSDGTTALTNGTTYSVEVRAVNAVGAGTSSGVAEGIARTVPDAPSLTAVSSLPGGLQVHFDSAANGGAPITSYQYRLNGGTWTSTGTLAEDFTISSLSNGTSYSVDVRAINSVGAGAPSVALSATPAAQPGQPTITSVTAGDRSLSVAANLASTGGSAITSWQYSTDGGATWSTASRSTSPFSITTLSSDSGTALVNGTSYSIALRAVNAVGKGAASATQVGIPMTTPDAPTVVLSPQDSGILVTYTAGSTGGSSITGVQYSLGGSWIDGGSLTGQFVIGSLVNGTPYNVQVRLVNGVGAGAVSTTQSATPRTIPDAPASVAAAPDGGQATVSWSAPASDGGSAITGYTATAWSDASGGTAVATCTTTTLSCVTSGLTNGTTYYVSVQATNVVGAGRTSSPRVAVIPLAKPSAPTISSITPANTYLSVNFSPGSAGSSPITSYQYTVGDGTWVSVATTASPLVISSLTNGVTYHVALRAVNASGAGASSSTVDATPFGVPNVPDASMITATPEDGSALVNWIAPADNGSPITGYDVVAWSAAIQGSQQRTCTTTGALTCDIGPLSDGTTYYITVDATNAAGTTTRSTPRVAVTPGAPGEVTDLTGVAGDGDVSLSWAAGSAGSSAISGYTVWYAPVGSTSFTQFGGTITSGTAVDVTGLTDGTAYTFNVYPVNSYGIGQVANSDSYTPTGPGIVPTFGTPVSTNDGFTVAISPYDPNTVYSATTDHGSVSIAGGVVTVTGLNPGASADVTVTAVALGRTTVQGDVEGSALLAGTVPQFGTPTSTADGFTVELTNPIDGVTYTPSVSAGDVSIAGTLMTVTGLSPSESATVRLLATATGYSDESAQVQASALASGIAPLLSTPVQTDDGFVVSILNPDALGSYDYTVDFGSVSLVDGTLTVTGLSPDQSATLSVTALHAGFTNASTSTVSNALGLGADLTRSAIIRTADGFSFSLVNFDPAFSYTVSTNLGSVTMVGGVITVTGLRPGQVAEVSILATQAGDRDSQASVSASPKIARGTAPVLTTPVSESAGFSTRIANYSATATYTVSVSPGSVSRSGAAVTITGLTPGQAATVSVSVAVTGYHTASATASGTALSAAAPPVPDSIIDNDIGPGAGESWRGDLLAPSTTTSTPDGETVHSGSYWMNLLTSGHLLVDGHVVIAVGGSGTVTVNGFQPGTIVTAWAFSTRAALTSPSVRSDGTAVGTFVLPSSIKPGNHTLLASGTAADGRLVTLKIGFVVVPRTVPRRVTSVVAGSTADRSASLSRANGGSAVGWAISVLALLVLLGILFFLILWRRRRKDKDEEAQAA
jgi:titin